MSGRLTAVVLCGGSEEELPRCLESLGFADEILVVESGCGDAGREIARARGARVLTRPLDRFDAQRNWAQEQVTTPWLLFVDTDEIVPPDLARRIRAIVDGDTEAPAAYSIPRRNHFLGRLIRRCGWGRDRVVRLLRRGAARWEGSIHEKPRVGGAVGRIDEPLDHHPYPTISAYWDKLERYARMQAARDRERGRRAGFLTLVARPKATFLRMYVLRGGFLDGVHGFVLCGLSAFSSFTRAMRLWEMGLPPTASSPPPPRAVTAPSRGGPPVSVLIPACNEEANIEGAIDSASWADEVFVVDSFSADRTVELARARGARLVQHEYVNSTTQKNWALPRTAHPWAMVLDADERFTPELAREVREVLASGPDAAGYWIRRTNHFLGRRIRFGGWDRDRVIRLFDRTRCRYQDVEVHGEILADGPVGRLRGRLLHYTYRSVDQYWPKFRRYTDWGSSQAYADGKRAGLYQLMGHPTGRFFKMYVVRLGMLDGTHGLVIALLSFFSVFNKYAKLWELALPGRGGAGAGDRRAERAAGAGR